jgi:hypothetical protein
MDQVHGGDTVTVKEHQYRFTDKSAAAFNFFVRRNWQGVGPKLCLPMHYGCATPLVPVFDIAKSLGINHQPTESPALV